MFMPPPSPYLKRTGPCCAALMLHLAMESNKVGNLQNSIKTVVEFHSVSGNPENFFPSQLKYCFNAPSSYGKLQSWKPVK